MQLLTRNGHNMYDMASMMQKAIRRNLPRYASYAAYELYGNYYSYVWKRLLVISAEDCYGIMTHEIMSLKLADDEVNAGRKGYDRDTVFLAKAVMLLCMAKKNRDACYVACNFMEPNKPLSEIELQKIGHVNMKELANLRLEDSQIPDWVFDVHTLKGKYNLHKTELDMIISEENALKPHQYSLFDYGDWSEYMEKRGEKDDAYEKFAEEQRKKQIDNGTEENFKKL